MLRVEQRQRSAKETLSRQWPAAIKEKKRAKRGEEGGEKGERGRGTGDRKSSKQKKQRRGDEDLGNGPIRRGLKKRMAISRGK